MKETNIDITKMEAKAIGKRALLAPLESFNMVKDIRLAKPVLINALERIKVENSSQTTSDPK